MQLYVCTHNDCGCGWERLREIGRDLKFRREKDAGGEREAEERRRRREMRGLEEREMNKVRLRRGGMEGKQSILGEERWSGGD